MKRMFDTAEDAYYLLQNGRWEVRSDLGTSISNYIYLGSIDKSKNDAFYEKSGFDISKLVKQLLNCDVNGFQPSFIEGNVPFGIWGLEPGKIYYDGKIVIKGKISTSFHITAGEKIQHIYDKYLATDQNWLKAKEILNTR